MWIWLLAGVFLGLLLAFTWPGNPAEGAVISVTDSLRSTLAGA